MKIKNTVISALLIVATLFVQLNISSEWAYGVNPGEPFSIVEERESSIKNGQENIPVTTRAIIGFNRNIATDDVLEHNKGLIKIYDQSGNEISANVTAEGTNKLEVSIPDGLQPGQRYYIKVLKGIAAQGGGEFTENEYDITFTTEGSTPAEEQTEPVSELDELKEEVERAKRESEENAKLMKEAEEQKKKNEEEAKKLQEAQKEVDIPKEKEIDANEIDDAVKQEETGEDTQDKANPKVFVFAVAILALIVIILVALMQSINRNKKDIEDLEEKADEDGKDQKDESPEVEAEEVVAEETDSETSPEAATSEEAKGEVDASEDTDMINGATGRFEGLDRKDRKK